MLPGIIPVPFIGPAKSVVYQSFLNLASQTVAGASLTFSSMSVGNGFPGRRIIACLGVGQGNALTVTGCTIGGVAATIVNQITSGGNTAAIAIALVGTGATVSVVWTVSATGLIWTAPTTALFTAYGLTSNTAVNSQTGNTEAGTSVSVTTISGIIVAVHEGGGSISASGGWTGATSSKEQQNTTENWVSFACNNATAPGSTTVSHGFTGGNGGTASAFVAASW